MKFKNLLRTMAVMVAGAVMALTLTSCGKSSDSSGSKTEATAATTSAPNGVLRVGMECAYAPFNWTQVDEKVSNGDTATPIYGGGGYAYGYDVMIAQKLAKELGMSLEVHKVEWDSIGVSMDSNEYDCIIAGMGRTKERELSYSFTEPYYYRDNCIVVKKGSDFENVKGLSDLKGKNAKVTTQLGTGWVPLLEQIPDAQKGANYETTAEVFMALNNGTADVAVIDVPTVESALLTNKELKIIELDENDTFKDDEEMTNVCIATRKDDTELRDKLQGAMDKINLDRDTMNKMMDEAIKVQPASN